MSMEVTVLEARGPPSRPVLAVSSGAVRRQAKLQVNQPFVIPHPRGRPCNIEVSLFQQLACQQVLPPAADSAEEGDVCSIPVRKPDGGACQVKLKLSRSDNPSKKLAPKAAEPVKCKTLDEEEEALKTRQYLEQHQLQYCIQGLIQDVLQEQPIDPYKYMLRQLRRCQGGGDARAPVPTPEEAKQRAERIEEENRLKPVPPAGPNTGRPGKQMPQMPSRQARFERLVAKCSLRLVFRMPLVRAAGEESVREEVQIAKARRIVPGILSKARASAIQQAAAEARKVSSKRKMVQSILGLSYVGAAELARHRGRQTVAAAACKALYGRVVDVIRAGDKWEDVIDPIAASGP